MTLEDAFIHIIRAVRPILHMMGFIVGLRIIKNWRLMITWGEKVHICTHAEQNHSKPDRQ